MQSITRKTTPLRLGITPWHMSSAMDASALCTQAELAEECGYHSFWLPESHFAGQSSVPEPILLLAAVAARTTSIKLGTTSYLLPIRNALQAAEQVAVLDQLSGGRLILGLGRGFERNMLSAFGVNPKEKRELLERHLDIMKAAWAGESIGSEAIGAVMSPLPVQKPHPPIWMAAFGPKALAQAAEMGTPYLASPMESMHQLKENYQIYNRVLDAACRPRPSEIAVMRTVFISDDKSLCEQVTRDLEQLAGTLKLGSSTMEKSWIVGNAEEVIGKIRQYQEQLGMNYLIVARPRIKGLSRECAEQSMRVLAAVAADLQEAP
jgi:alkanesulfonate monooxygenase SsuD/methylene tetrahydromethanopterin reductase-like flavin-dependent oxidoreductase (luciferase family)